MCPLKILVTGASGLLGRAVVSEAKSRGYEVIGLAYSRCGDNLIRCDLTKSGEFEKILERVKPNIIIHAAAQRFPDKVESEYEKTRRLNVDSSERLAKAAKDHGSRFIYISTDYVFDGTSPPYTIDSEANPINLYGVTKLDGENASIKANADTCILRIPILYGDVESIGESAVTTLISTLLSDKEQKMSHLEKRYPSHTNDIASILCDLSQLLINEPNHAGIFQWGGKEQLTKYEMVRIMSKVFSLSSNHLIPDVSVSQGAKRPMDCRLDVSRLENLGISHHTPFEKGIESSLKEYVSKAKNSI